MINADGFKAFHGTMRITMANGSVSNVTGDWIYRPNGYWYHGFQSWPEKCCEVLDDQTVKHSPRACPYTVDVDELRTMLAAACRERDELRKKLEERNDGT